MLCIMELPVCHFCPMWKIFKNQATSLPFDLLNNPVRKVMIFLVSQMRKFRMLLPQVHTVIERWGWDLNLGFLIASPVDFPLTQTTIPKAAVDLSPLYFLLVFITTSLLKYSSRPYDSVFLYVQIPVDCTHPFRVSYKIDTVR